jgi:hypothetical protein
VENPRTRAPIRSRRTFSPLPDTKADLGLQFVNDRWVTYDVAELTLLRCWADK